MSDGQVQIKVTMDSSSVQQGAQKVNSSLSSIEKQTSSGLGFGVLAGVGQTAFNMVANAVMGALNAIIDLVTAAAQFESQMSKVEAISGATSTAMDALEHKAREMGATTVFSAKEAGQAMEYMAMAGWKATDMLNGIEGVMNLAAASGEDLAKVSDILTDAITAFGDEAKDAERYADVMASTSSNANTNVALLGETFKYVGATAGSLGYKIEDIALATGLMANAGIKGSMAGTALRSTISRMASPTKQVKDAMEKLGISLTDSEGNMLSFRDVMLQMRSGFSNLSEVEQASTAKMLGGAYAMSGLLAVVNATEEDFNKLADAIDNSAGSSADMANTMTDNLEGSLKKFGSQAAEFGITLYEQIKGPLKEIIEFGTSALEFLTNLVADHRSEVIKYCEDLNESTRQAKKLLDSTKSWESDVAQGVGELESYRDVLLAVADAEKADEYQKYQMNEIVAKLGGSIPELTEAWDEQNGVLRMSKDRINDLINSQEDYLRLTTMQNAKKTVYEAMYTAQLNVAKAQGVLKSKFNEASKLVTNELAKMGDYSGGTIKNLDELQAVMNKLRDTGNNELSDSLVLIYRDAKAAQDAVDEAIPVYESSKEAVEELELGIAEEEAQQRKATNVTKEDTEAKQENKTATKEQIDASARLEEAQAKLSESYQNAKQKIVDALNTVEETAKKTFSVNLLDTWSKETQKSAWEMLDALTKQKADMEQYTQNMETIFQRVQGISGGLDFFQALQDLGPQGARIASDLASGAVDIGQAVQKYVDATNVSEQLQQNFIKNSVAVMEGTGLLSSSFEDWEGLTSLVDTVIESGAEVSEAVQVILQDAVEVAKGVGAEIPEGLKEAILNADGNYEEAFAKIADELTTASSAKMDAMLEFVEGLGIEVPQHIKTGIEAGGQEAINAYNELIAMFGASETTTRAKEEGKKPGKEAAKATAEAVKGEKGETAEAGKEIIDTFTGQVKSGIPNATSAGAEIGRAGAGGAISTTALWADAGLNVARGFAGGIRAGKNEAINAAVEISKASYTAAHNYNEIGSPSKLYRREIGYMIGKGFALGLTDALSLVKSASNILSDTAFDDAYSATKSIEKAFAKMKETMQNGAEKGNFADSYKKAMETASSSIKNAVNGAKDSMKKASDKYFTALADANASKIEALEKQQKALREKRGDGNYKETEEEKEITKEIEALKTRKSKIDKLKSEFASSVVSAYGSALENRADSIQKFLENRLDKITSSYQSKMDSVKSKISTMQSGLLSVGDTFNGTMTGRTLIDNVKQQISSMRDYENQLKELQSRGISKTLLKEIETMDVSQASEYMSALLTMSDAELEKYNKLFVKRAKEAKRIASEHYSDEVEAIKTGYIDEITYLFERVETAISKMGAQMMKGFINGMKETDYSREIRKMAKNIIKSMAEELQIHSPSKSAWNLGMLFSLGFTKAIEAGTKQVERAMEQYADAGTESMKKELLSSINPPEIERIRAINGVGSSGTIANAQNNGIAEAEYNITLITTLDGREIARGTAVYTQSELSRLQTIQARKEGYI